MFHKKKCTCTRSYRIMVIPCSMRSLSEERSHMFILHELVGLVAEYASKRGTFGPGGKKGKREKGTREALLRRWAGNSGM
jgi:hypothetical protein